MDQKDVRLLYDEIEKIYDSITEQEQEISILFIDLARSTEYKVRYGANSGLSRTFLHNSLVTKLAAMDGGKVVKYIGDEVMMFTEGPDHGVVACRLAKEVQRSMADLSRKHQGDPRFPLESKIGIHSGRVQYWQYPGHSELDPQGTTVDTAARIASLARPQQILCSDATAAGSSLSSDELGTAEERYVKGIKGPVKVVEVLWDGSARGVAQNPMPAVEDPEVRKWVAEAESYASRGDNDAALKRFRTAAEKAPSDFSSNFRLGEHLARRLGQLTEAMDSLSRAKVANPSSPPLLLLEGFIAWKQFETKKNASALDRAIGLTEECLRQADLSVDRNSLRLASGNLAYYLGERNHKGDLDRALKLCENARNAQDVIERREMSGLLDTFALVLLKKGGREEVIKARELLEEAIRRDSQNPYPLTHMAELIRKEQTLGIKKGVGSIY